MRIAEILDFYWEKKGQNTLTWNDCQRNFVHIKEHFGKLSPEDIYQQHIDAYIKKRAGLKSGTVRNEIESMVTAVNYVHRHGLCQQIQKSRLILPRRSPPRERCLSEAEVERLLAAAAESRGLRMTRAERFIWIALETGARRRSIELLEWDRVDFERGTIDFRIPGKAETKKRQVKVPISSALRPVLEQAYRDRCSRFVLDTRATAYQTFMTACRRAGMEGVMPHTMRHTCATRLLKRGVDVHTVARILGCSVEKVIRVYGHSSWEAMVAALG